MSGLVVVDSSFWIDFPRRAVAEPEALLLEDAMREERAVMLQIVWLELVVGFRSPAERNFLREIRGVCRWEPLTENDGTAAEQIAVNLRAKGGFLGASDLLVLTAARRLNAKLLHHDEDFTGVLKFPDFARMRR
jgi:predicted nucleic acid-binding protein